MTTDHQPPGPVTVLGLGLMGRALAEAFLRAGHPTTVWNRTAAKAEPLVDRGALLADSPAEAVGASPLVVVCLTDHDAVRSVLDAAAPALAGRVVANLTSGTSEQARSLAGWVSAQDAEYLDGAIMADPPTIATDGAIVLYSGPRPAFDRHAPALRALARASDHLGVDPGLAALYEVAVMGLMWSILDGFLHGAALLGRAGVDAAAFAPIARGGIETVAGWVEGYGKQIDDDDFPPTDATLDVHLAAMEHLVAESERLGVNAELPRLVRSLATRAAAAGHGARGYATLIAQFRRPAGAA